MACYNPNRIHVSIDHGTGMLIHEFRGPAKYDNPLSYGTIDNLSSDGSYDMIVPCGKCLGCQIDYSREWANRMCIELDDNPKAIFVTLTYNDVHLPLTNSGTKTLRKRDLQLFWKRLRKAYPDVRIRYYVAGEYGSKTFRPHYHAIIYGLSLDDFTDLQCVGWNELKQPYYSSPKFAAIWGNGFVQMSEVTYRTCAYVARYVLKKHYGADMDDLEPDQECEFNLSSRRPGIGLLHAADYVLSGNNMFALNCRDGVHDISLPKSFIRHCKNNDVDIDKLNEICYNRSKDAYDRLCSNLRFSEKSYIEFLATKEANLASKIRLLPERGN